MVCILTYSSQFDWDIEIEKKINRLIDIEIEKNEEFYVKNSKQKKRES